MKKKPHFIFPAEDRWTVVSLDSCWRVRDQPPWLWEPQANRYLRLFEHNHFRWLRERFHACCRRPWVLPTVYRRCYSKPKVAFCHVETESEFQTSSYHFNSVSAQGIYFSSVFFFFNHVAFLLSPVSSLGSFFFIYIFLSHFSRNKMTVSSFPVPIDV